MEFYTFAKKHHCREEEQPITAFERQEQEELRQRKQQRLYRPRRFQQEQEEEEELYTNQPYYFYETEFLSKKKPFHNVQEDEEEELYTKQPYYFYETEFLSKKKPFYNVQEDEEEELYTKQPYYFYQNEGFSKKQPFEMEEEQERRPRRKTSTERKWIRVIDAKNFRPEEIKMKVNPIKRTLTIRAKSLRQPMHQLKRVIPLPRNLIVEEIRVKFTPNGELIVKAPYQTRDYEETNTPIGKFTVPIIFVQGKRQQRQRQLHQQEFFQPRFEYFHLLQNATTPKKYVDTKWIRDETTGEYKIVFIVNTVGFRREEIKIDFQEEERLLLVKAKHQLREEEFDQLKGIVPKTLIREFILPEWLEVEEMRYTVMKNGVLRIEVPCQAKYFKKYQQENFYKYF